MKTEAFKNRIRNRVCGILTRDDAILLVQLKSPVTHELIWMPPGGGLQFGESMRACLRREFREETGLEVAAGSLVFVQEMIASPFHAVEHYFRVESTGGELRLGRDPELTESNQLLRDIRWMPVKSLSDYQVVPENLAALTNQPDGSIRFSST